MAGGQSAQILQQVEGLLTQLAQNEPEPQIQQAIQGVLKQIEPLQQLVGQDDAADMQGGLANPGGGLGEAPTPGTPPGPGGAEGLPSVGGAPGGEPSPEGGGEHHVVEVHIHDHAPAKTFAGARKAAMATHAERGHFDRGTPKGETPSTPKTKARTKG